jgi:hypothetical protein
VHVAVEQAREDRVARAIDLLVAVEARTDGHDPPMLDHHIGVGGSGAGAVEDLPCPEHDPRHDAAR